MPTISISIDLSKNEIYLLGDTNKLKLNRFAWRYTKDYLHASFEYEKIIVPIAEEEVVQVLSKIRSMLIKYDFKETISDCSEKILIDFYNEEQNFLLFSNKALNIHNNICDTEDFKKFTDILSSSLTNRSLYPLQLLSAYHMAFSQNACNFSVPGAGKTSIVYGAYTYLHNLPDNDSKRIDKLLIVGPLSSFGPWELEFAECFGSFPDVKRLTSGMRRLEKRDYLYSKNPSELTLISYASLAALKDDLGYFLRNNKVMIVLDEAHKAKNTSGGIIAQSILDLAKYGCSRVVLTGTPAPNGYEDLYNMFRFIWPTKNVLGFEVNQLRDISARGNDLRVNRLIHNISPYFIRIKKSDLNIPSAISHPPILVDMGPIQQRIYDFIEKKYIDSIIDDAVSDTSSRFKTLLTRARIIRLMQAASDPAMLKAPLREFIEYEDCPTEAVKAIDDNNILNSILEYETKETPAKYEAVKKLVTDIIAEGGKVVIWASFIHTIHGLRDYLDKNGIKAEELYGAIPIEKDGFEEENESQILTRERIVRDFQIESCPYKVIIANPYAVAESISLHKTCHNAIYIERSFNVAHFVQSKDRIHRYGLEQNTKTNYYYVLSRESIDETIELRLSEKEKRMIEIMESMPIPLFNNINEDLLDDDIKVLIKNYVSRIRKT